ncbi:hypothetical protein R0J87_20615, partial [Halomonas sp. SIMBA_159]
SQSAIIPDDPERIAGFLRAANLGAAELETASHLAADGKGRADATDLGQDLLDLLTTARS